MEKIIITEADNDLNSKEADDKNTPEDMYGADFVLDYMEEQGIYIRE